MRLASGGETYLLARIAELLALVLDVQGRLHAAEALRPAAELAANDTVKSQALWPSVGGTAFAWQERADEAEWRARGPRRSPDRGSLSASDQLVRAKRERGRRALGVRATRWGCARRRCSGPGLTREGFLREILVNESSCRTATPVSWRSECSTSRKNSSPR
jgi:hypothetical protein